MPATETGNDLRVELKLEGRATSPISGQDFEIVASRLNVVEAECSSSVCPRVGDPLALCLDWPLAATKYESAQLEGLGTVIRLELAHRSLHGFTIRFQSPPHLYELHRDENGRTARQDTGIPTLLRPSPINEEAFQYYQRLERVRDFVRENYSETVRLEAVARIAGMQSAYFSDFFKRKVGVSFSEWLQQIRIAKAVDLIYTRNHSITHIAHEAGFANLRSFERAFRKRTDLTPVEFKKLVRPS